jgi:uncharacterized protein (DUF1697 family)
MHIALLRGVNLAGRRAIAMADLRALATELGFTDVTTLLQSGNLVFRSNGKTPAALERLLEAETEKRLGLRTDYYVRTGDEWREVIAGNPFATEAKKDPAHLVVLCLKKAPGAKAFDLLQRTIKGHERVIGDGRHAYVYYPDGIGRSKLTTAIIDRAIGAGTARNWNTVTKLAALISA